MQYCTAGASVIEIDPRGNVFRCVKFARKGKPLGNLLEDDRLRLLDLDRDDAGCALPCPPRMCVAHNVIRSETPESFHDAVGQRGVRGLYFNPERLAVPDILVRWAITDRCNYTCDYCTAWRTVNQRGLEATHDDQLVMAEKLVAQLSGIGLRLTGGEPSTSRSYVAPMRLLNRSLDRFTNIEVRTNFSFPAKQEEVLALDWRSRLHYHIGCHIMDRNFRPWDWIERLRGPHSITYHIKFVRNSATARYIDFFREYFVANGIPPRNIIVVDDIRTRGEAPAAVPPAYRAMTEGRAAA